MIKYCTKCLFPNTKPDLFFDKDGVCDACNSANRKHGNNNSINWQERELEFSNILETCKIKDGHSYNCIIPVSGGKDSTWQVYAMKMLHNMKPLAVTFDQFDQTDTGIDNLNVLKNIGVDHIHFTLNPVIVKKLVKKGLEIIGDPYWVNHVGMFTIPFHIAVNFKIPLLVYGENPQLEYGGPLESRDNRILDHRWRQEFGGMRGFREEDMIDNEISAKDLSILNYPNACEIKALKIKGIFYGQYFKWDADKHIEICKKLGWKPLESPSLGSWLNYENCDMKYIDIREYLKFLKYGYGRATDQLNIAIRNGKISREKAMSIAKAKDGAYSESNLNQFCDYLEMSNDEFHQIAEQFVNHEILHKKCNKWILK